MKKQLSRRAMLKQTIVAGLGGLFDPFPHQTITNQSMLKRPIPSSEELLPIVGLGSWQQFDVGSSDSDRQPLRQVLTLMQQQGGKLIDASPMYGRAEEVIGDLTTTAGSNANFFLATKVWTTGRQAGIDQLNDSFRKMRRKTLELVQVHNLVDWQTQLQTLREWKRSGKVRYIGVTHYTTLAHDQLERVIKSEAIDFLQVNYSIRIRDAERSLLPTAREKGVAVIINEPFESGSLFQLVKGKALPSWSADYDIKSWAQLFLKFILSNPAVTCVIPGTSDPKHLLDNMGAGYGRLPDEKGQAKLAAFLASL
jgi:diketogulonate reductase-like aldo/keto reductase